MQRSIKPEVGPRVMLPHGEKSNYCQSQETCVTCQTRDWGKHAVKVSAGNV